ncbi:MAG: ABC transporter permease [Solirubrobacteraceae bacterium]
MSAIADVEIESAGALHADRQEVRRELLRELLRSPAFLVGAFIVLVWIVCAIFGSAIAPHSPYAQNLLGINKAPSSAHPFGTDQLGRDMLSRVIVGSRDILVIAPLATLLGTVLGTAVGLVMGYFRGIVDDVLGRVVEAFLALPLIVTALLALAALGRSNAGLIVVIGIVFTPLIARTVRAAVLQEVHLDYIAAARLRGEGPLYIMFVEILPNVFAPIVVEFTVRLAYAIFTVLTLTFLGFGVQPPSPDWGLDIATNYGVVTAGYWWEVLFDALAIASLVVAVTLVSESIEGVLER